MSENGGDKQNQLFDRFLRLVGHVRPRSRVRMPEPSKADPEIALAIAMSGWAAQSPDEFKQWLDHEIEESHSLVEQHFQDHATVAFYLGYQAALRNLRGRFDSWSRGQAPSAPQGETNAG